MQEIFFITILLSVTGFSRFECRVLRSEEQVGELLQQQDIVQPQQETSQPQQETSQLQQDNSQLQLLEKVDFKNCLEHHQFDLQQFIAESKQLTEKHQPRRRYDADRARRTAGSCGTFALFPFLAFLYAASTLSTNVINTVNNSNENNNNNNNNNLNTNMNMNVNMNARRRRDANASMFDGSIFRSLETLPSITGIFQPGENLSAGFRRIQKSLDTFQIPGLPSVGELREKIGMESTETLFGDKNSETLSVEEKAETLSGPAFANLLSLQGLLPSSFQLTQNPFPNLAAIFTFNTKVFDAEPGVPETGAELEAELKAELEAETEAEPEAEPVAGPVAESGAEPGAEQGVEPGSELEESSVTSTELPPQENQSDPSQLEEFLNASFDDMEEFETSLKDLIENSPEKEKLLKSLKREIEKRVQDILDKTELNSVSVDDVPGEYWFEDRSGEPVETSPTPGILYTSLKLNLTHERKKEKEETKLPRGRTGKIQGTGDILSELEMNAEKEIQENNTTPFPEPLEEDTEEEMKRVESVQQDPGYDDSDPNEIDKDGNRRKDKKIRGQGFKEDLKLDDTGKESENKVVKTFSLQHLMKTKFKDLYADMWNRSQNIPLIKEITEDISKVSEIIKNSTISSTQLNHKSLDDRIRSDFDGFHFTHHVKNASEEIKKFKLPGLPSIGDILNNSLSYMNMSSGLPNLDTLVSQLSFRSAAVPETEETKAKDKADEKSEIESEEVTGPGGTTGSPDIGVTVALADQLNLADKLRISEEQSLEEYFLQGLRTVVDEGFIRLRYSLDEATKVFVPENGENITLLMDPAATVKNLSITLLRGLDNLPVPSSLEGLVNPTIDLDVENIEKVLKLAPRLLPYIMQDYKDKLHGLMVGTTVTQDQLFEIHSSLVEWHNKIESVRDGLPGGGIHRVLGILQEHNLSLLYLLVHLMHEAGETGKVGITHHHLQVIDRHLLRPEDLFPGLKLLI